MEVVDTVDTVDEADEPEIEGPAAEDSDDVEDHEDVDEDGRGRRRPRTPSDEESAVALAPATLERVTSSYAGASPLTSVAPLASVADEPAESWVATAQAGTTPPPAAATAYDLLDSRSPMPEPTEDETPIFRDAAVQLVHLRRQPRTPGRPRRSRPAGRPRSRSPRRPRSSSASPGCRCGVPASGWCPAVSHRRAVNVERDPEAIRARLAAHAAGVSRGRTAAVDESVPEPSTEEGPA